MNKLEFLDHLKNFIRYLANLILVISIAIIIVNLAVTGDAFFENVLVWTQLATLWILVIMLILVENFYLAQSVEEAKKSKRK